MRVFGNATRLFRQGLAGYFGVAVLLFFPLALATYGNFVAYDGALSDSLSPMLLGEAMVILGISLALTVLGWSVTYALQASSGTASWATAANGIVKRLGSWLLLSILITLGVLLGGVLYIVPGLILLFLWSLAPVVFVQKQLSVLAALRQSTSLMLQHVGTGLLVLVPVLGGAYGIQYLMGSLLPDIAQWLNAMILLLLLAFAPALLVALFVEISPVGNQSKG